MSYLAACVTLQGGCEAEGATALVKQEREAFGDRSPVRDNRLVALLRDALAPSEGDGVDAVRPDLIGEAFLLEELTRERRSRPQQAPIVERAFARAGPRVVETVIRTAQDHARGEAAHPSVAWLDHLAHLTDDPFLLMAIADQLPEQTLALRERAAEITGRIVDGLARLAASDPEVNAVRAGWLNDFGNRLSDLGRREDALAAAEEAVALRRTLAAQRPDAFRPDLAGSLNNLANRLSDLGRREDALAAAEEAVALYRTLAAQRPDAFRPDLATSLSVRADCLDAMGQLDLALADDVEAIAVLTPGFVRLPQAFAPLMAEFVRDYAQRCEKHGTEPDRALLAPIEAEFARMQAQPEAGTGGGGGNG